MSRSRKNTKFAKKVQQAIVEAHAPILRDITWRLEQLREEAGRPLGLGSGQVFAEDFNTLQHQLTGYTVTNNSPAAGSIAWVDVHVVYAGIDYTITNGSTALKYVTFKLPASPPAAGATVALVSSADKPALVEGDILLFINEGGVARNALSMTNQTMPRVVATNAVDNDAIAAGAVESGNIKDLAITTAKVADGAISKTAQITGKIVGTGQMVASAVDSTILAAGAINNQNKFSGKVIPGGSIVDNTVPGTAVLNGAITPTKTNILQHIMY